MKRLAVGLACASIAVPAFVLAQTPARSGLALVRSIGAQAGLPEGFFRIADVAVGDSGRLYILDSGNCMVALFDGRGRFERRFGRCGSGPGEFMLPTRVIVDRDGPAVFDARLGRMTFLDRTGAVIRTETIDRAVGTRLEDLMSLRGGAIGITMGNMTEPRADKLYQHVLWLHSGDIDTVASFHSGAVGFHGRGQRLPYGIAPKGFGRTSDAAVVGDSLLVLVDAVRGEVRYLKPAGDQLVLSRTVSFPVRLKPIGAADRKAIESEIRAQTKTQMPDLDLLLPPGISPLGGNTFVADDGALWVGMRTASPGGPRRWLVFRRGNDPAWVETPANFALITVHSGLYYGICRDNLDVESVCVFRNKTAD